MSLLAGAVFFAASLAAFAALGAEARRPRAAVPMMSSLVSGVLYAAVGSFLGARAARAGSEIIGVALGSIWYLIVPVAVGYAMTAFFGHQHRPDV